MGVRAVRGMGSLWSAAAGDGVAGGGPAEVAARVLDAIRSGGADAAVSWLSGGDAVSGADSAGTTMAAGTVSTVAALVVAGCLRESRGGEAGRLLAAMRSVGLRLDGASAAAAVGGAGRVELLGPAAVAG